MIQAVIFNLESTLLDPGGRGLTQGMRDIFRWKGIQVTEEQVSHGRGMPIRDHIANVLGLSEVRKNGWSALVRILAERILSIFILSLSLFSAP